QIDPQPFVPGQANPGAQQPGPADLPSGALWKQKAKAEASQFVSHLGEVTLQNASAFLGHDPTGLPDNASAARAWLHENFAPDGRFALKRT
ncbi:MAG: hypothetical protein RLZ55_1762, partial [Actinomycetota bacterium]